MWDFCVIGCTVAAYVSALLSEIRMPWGGLGLAELNIWVRLWGAGADLFHQMPDPGCNQTRGDHLSWREKTLFSPSDGDNYTMRRSRRCGENGATCESPPQTYEARMPLTHNDAADPCRDSPGDRRVKFFTETFPTGSRTLKTFWF